MSGRLPPMAVPAESTLAAVVVPAAMLRTMMSLMLGLASFGTSPCPSPTASKTTTRPSALMAGSSTPLVPCGSPPWLLTLTFVVVPAATSRITMCGSVWR